MHATRGENVRPSTGVATRLSTTSVALDIRISGPQEDRESINEEDQDRPEFRPGQDTTHSVSGDESGVRRADTCAHEHTCSLLGQERRQYDEDLDDPCLSGNVSTRWSQPQLREGGNNERENSLVSACPVGWFAPTQQGAVSLRPACVIPPIDQQVKVTGRGSHNGRVWTEITTSCNEERTVQRYPLPAQTALVAAVISAVSRAQTECRPSLVLETEPWLPKHLLLRGAKFHGVVLFDRVERLHELVEKGTTRLVLVSAR